MILEYERLPAFSQITTDAGQPGGASQREIFDLWQATGFHLLRRTKHGRTTAGGTSDGGAHGIVETVGRMRWLREFGRPAHACAGEHDTDFVVLFLSFCRKSKGIEGAAKGFLAVFRIGGDDDCEFHRGEC